MCCTNSSAREARVSCARKLEKRLLQRMAAPTSAAEARASHPSGGRTSTPPSRPDRGLSQVAREASRAVVAPRRNRSGGRMLFRHVRCNGQRVVTSGRSASARLRHGRRGCKCMSPVRRSPTSARQKTREAQVVLFGPRCRTRSDIHVARPARTRRGARAAKVRRQARSVLGVGAERLLLRIRDASVQLLRRKEHGLRAHD